MQVSHLLVLLLPSCSFCVVTPVPRVSQPPQGSRRHPPLEHVWVLGTLQKLPLPKAVLPPGVPISCSLAAAGLACFQPSSPGLPPDPWLRQHLSPLKSPACLGSNSQPLPSKPPCWREESRPQIEMLRSELGP